MPTNQTNFPLSKKNGIPQGQDGFTLIELAVSLVVISVLFSVALLSAAQYLKAQKVKQTNAKIALVENALSSYVQQHYRLPCPADPQAADGREVNNGNCFNNSSNANLYWTTEGVLPWKELGIPQNLAVDSWQHYFTYKPAPQLTTDNISDTMTDKANTDAVNDTHNSCRTAIWYDAAGEHINRAKALFCCNAAPKTAYRGPHGISALTSDWLRNGVVDTTTSKTVSTAGTSMPTNTNVVMTGNWMDPSTTASVHGSFQGFNSSQPEPPLLRATGLAVTLISHGGNGDLAFLPEQAKTRLTGGATVNVGAGVTGSSNSSMENGNVWPPHIFSGILGHAKNADGSYDPLNPRAGSSDDMVALMRSDDLYARVGQGSCERPPAAVFQPAAPCRPIPMQMQYNTFNPVNGPKVTMDTISLRLSQDEGIPFTLQSTAQRLDDEAGYHNSLGVYVIAPDGSIQGVQLVSPDMKNMQIGGNTTAAVSQISKDASSVGTFILPNGFNVNNSYQNIDMSTLQLVHNFGQSDQRPANVADTDLQNVNLVAKNTQTGQMVALNGANTDGSGNYNPANASNNGIYHMYSQMNYGQLSRGWRPNNINPKTVLNYAGVDPADPTKMQVGFEDLATINCYYTNSGACVSTEPPMGPGPNDAALDQYGGYMTRIGDNDYDDVAVSMKMNKCSLRN